MKFTVANGETKYFEIPVTAGTIGEQLAWLDATSSATVTLELTDYLQVAAAVPGSAWEWKDSGVSITGPAASAAGSALILIENVRVARARLKIVGAAASSFEIPGLG